MNLVSWLSGKSSKLLLADVTILGQNAPNSITASVRLSLCPFVSQMEFDNDSRPSQILGEVKSTRVLRTGLLAARRRRRAVGERADPVAAVADDVPTLEREVARDDKGIAAAGQPRVGRWQHVRTSGR